MPQLVVVADDLTGAADTGACFAGVGFSTVIPLTSSNVPRSDVIVFSTESRDLSAIEAARAVTGVVARDCSGQPIA